nr:DUF998 domain-containing protein [Galbitalea soli]
MALAGAALVLIALAIIWAARLSDPANAVYVSELGATGAPTAREFEAALILIVAGGSAIAWAARDVRSRVRMLAAWSPSVSLWIACGFFLVASQVTCTAGCPLPYGPSFDWQDLTHITVAVLAFAAACWAMLQTSFARERRVIAWFSLVMGASVATIAAAGGLLSLAQVATDVGSRFELIATTLAIGWVATFGSAVAVGRLRGQRAEMTSSSRLASPTRM